MNYNKVDMRFIILLIFILLPMCVSAKFPELEALCERYDKHKSVTCDNVGRLMLRTYADFLPKEDKPIFQSLDNITMLECGDSELSTTIKSEAEAILASLNISKCGTEERDGMITDVYLVNRQDTILELISISIKDGCLMLSLLSGEMTAEKLARLAEIKP